MRTFNLISNISNGAGLQKDTELLKRLLESYGHQVTCTMFNTNPIRPPRVEVNIFLEVVNPAWIPFATQNWLVPNSEWWYACWEPCVPRFNKVLCKTKDCQRLWFPKVGNRAIYMDFEANDVYKPEIPKKPVFLHLAGKSETKNTAAVITTWRQFQLPFPLIVSAFKPCIKSLCAGVPNVTQTDRFSDEQVIKIVNECRFHVMPSKNEGYGHAIHEALSCKGAVITTDAPPMNEFSGVERSLIVPVHHKTPRPPLTFFYEITPAALAETVRRAAAMTEEELNRLGEAARAGFLSDREFFRKKFYEVVNGALAR